MSAPTAEMTHDDDRCSGAPDALKPKEPMQ